MRAQASGPNYSAELHCDRCLAASIPGWILRVGDMNLVLKDIAAGNL